MSAPVPYWTDGQVSLFLGDCRDVLPSLAPESVDAVVCDPPYDLTSGKRGGSGDASLNLAHPAGRSRITTGGGFMGKAWDATGVAFDPETWRAVLRVLKPGAYLLAFGGTRTWHRLTCAIEDAGFEIRDSVADLTGIDGPGLLWAYGSGFPKSLDVSKAIDKRAEENVETKRRIAAVAEVIRSHREARGMAPQQVSMAVVGTPSGACWNWEHQQLPSIEMWPAIKAVLGIPDKYDGLIEGDRARFIAAERAVIGQRTTGIGTGRGTVTVIVDGENRDLTAPATDDAARWSGWGTALKPSWEPIVVARKPLAGTVAQNVLAHGTGALNIAGCLLPPTGESRPRQGEPSQQMRYTDHGGTDFAALPGTRGGGPEGRWPPNLVLGETAATEMDRQSGVLTSGANPQRRRADKFRDAYGEFAGQPDCTPHRGADSGGASRFFPVFRYEAKAGAHERPRLEDGTAHATVKPVDLIAWLCRLVTPPGGLILDPFAGSGTTAEAAIVENFRCALVEKDPKSAELILERLRKPIQPGLFGEPA